MNAVDSEFKRNLPSDHWRLHRLQQAVSDPNHPFSGFHTGNLESLNVDGVLQLMIDHYQRNYSANLMRLVVLGRESLDQLEQWVREMCRL